MPVHRTCTRTGVPFTISEREREYCESRGIPLSEISPRERFREMLTFRNERTLFNRASSFTNKDIIACYRPDTAFPVIERDLWLSDTYDPLAYGRPYDFNRPFFEQYHELLQRIPHANLIVINAYNSPYVNLSIDIKNCYYAFSAVNSEDCLYVWRIANCRDVVDAAFVYDCEQCYECSDCRNGYNLRFAQHAFQCRDSSFLFDCIGCNDCFGCVGLRHQQYHIFNQPYTKEEYFKRIAGFDLSKYSVVEEFKKKFQDMVRTAGRYNSNRAAENSSGLYLENCHNCTSSYFLKECRDVENSMLLQRCQDCFSLYNALEGSQLIYYSSAAGRNSYNCQFCYQSDNIVDCQYGGILFFCEKMFGCFGFPRRASYCILNRQYSKTEYEDLLPRIIAHMKSTGEYGKFFPMVMSDFPYVDTVAQEYFPLNNVGDAHGRPLQNQVHWSDKKVFTTIDKGYPVADNIHEVPDSILSELLRDEETGRAYKLQKKELAFYRKMGVPVSRFSFETRHLKRSRALFQF